MTDDFFLNQVRKLAAQAELERVKREQKFNSRSEEWREGEQGEQCQAEMEAWDEANEELLAVADKFTEDLLEDEDLDQDNEDPDDQDDED